MTEVPDAASWRRQVDCGDGGVLGSSRGQAAAQLGAARIAALSYAFRFLGRTTSWMDREVASLSAVVGPGAVCLDVGAALGIYTAVLSDLAGPQGELHSVEPLPFVHPFWTTLLRPRNGGNVRRYALALGATPHTTTIRIPIRHGALVTGRSFLSSGANGVGSNDEFDLHIDVRVTVETLDRLCESAGIRRVDFLKIDVEGAELAVLAGADFTIERHRPDLLVEIEARHTCRYGHAPEAVVAWLVERGYQMHVLDGGSWCPAQEVSPGVCNYLFRHSARGLA